MSVSEPDYVVIGRITRPHGVTGEVRVEILTEEPERFKWAKTVFLSRRDRDTPRPYQIKAVRFHKGQALLKLAEINNREAADQLRSSFIRVPMSEAIPLEEGEFFLFQLYGMRVETVDGQHLGEIVDVLQTGANDVFVVKGSEYGEILIPDTEEVVQSIDGASRTVKVTLIDGLIS